LKNRLVVIGSLGNYRCYLNVPRDEAIRRYKDHYRRMKESDRAKGFEVLDDADYEQEEGADFGVNELEFDEEFLAYDIEEAWTYTEAGKLTPPI
jgi:hypothetical protein